MSQHISTTLPRVTPIVPTTRPQPFNDPAWLFEPKYDGFRGMLYVTRQSCMLYSKRGIAMTRFRDLAKQLREELPFTVTVEYKCRPMRGRCLAESHNVGKEPKEVRDSAQRRIPKSKPPSRTYFGEE